MRLHTLCIASLLAGCGTLAEPMAPEPPTTFFVRLPDDIYGFSVPVDLAHDTSDCSPAVPLKADQVPPTLSFTYYPCIGRPFNDVLVRPGGVQQTAAAAGKKFQIYKTVRFGEKVLGKVVVVYVPYRPAQPLTAVPVQ